MLKPRMAEQLFLEQLRSATYYSPIVLLDAFVKEQPAEHEECIRLQVATGADDIIAQDLPIIRMCLNQVLNHLTKEPPFLLCRAACYVNDEERVKISLFVDAPYDIRMKFSPVVLEIKRMMETHMTEELHARYLHVPPSMGA